MSAIVLITKTSQLLSGLSFLVPMMLRKFGCLEDRGQDESEQHDPAPRHHDEHQATSSHQLGCPNCQRAGGGRRLSSQTATPIARGKRGSSPRDPPDDNPAAQGSKETRRLSLMLALAVTSGTASRSDRQNGPGTGASRGHKPDDGTSNLENARQRAAIFRGRRTGLDWRRRSSVARRGRGPSIFSRSSSQTSRRTGAALVRAPCSYRIVQADNS